MEDVEISRAISLLQNIKDDFEAHSEKLTADAYKTKLENNENINLYKVNKIIETSFDWDKAIGQIINEIPQHFVEKINKTKDKTKLNEYKNLVDFILPKLPKSKLKNIEYLKYLTTQNKKFKVPYFILFMATFFFLILSYITHSELIFFITVVLGVILENRSPLYKRYS